MARLDVSGGTLTLALTRIERLEGFRRDPTSPLASVTAVRAVPDPWTELRGIRAPGTGLPGVVAVGTRRGGFGKDFAVVHGRSPGVVVEFHGQEFERWVLTVDDPESVARSLSEAAGLR